MSNIIDQDRYTELLEAIEAAADAVVELQDTVAAYLNRGETIPESLQHELEEASQLLDDLQSDLDECPIP